MSNIKIYAIKNLLVLLLNATLCCAHYTDEPELSRSNDSSSTGIWLGVAAWVAYTIIPNILKDLEKSETNQLTTDTEVEKAIIESDAIAATEKTAAKKNNKWKQMVVMSLYAVSLAVSAYIIYTAASEVVSAGKNLYNYLYPDAETVARIEKAKKTIATLDATREFRECLIKNNKVSRNAEGIPINCEDCGQVFGLTAGIEAYHDMVKLFKDTYSE